MKCLNCGKEIPQINGKKPRIFCNDTCRMAYNRAKANILRAKANKSEQDFALKANTFSPNTDIKRTKADTKSSKADKSEQVEDDKSGHPLGKKYMNNGKILEVGKCHGCGKDVSALICICRDCIGKGITHESLDLDVDKCDI